MAVCEVCQLLFTDTGIVPQGSFGMWQYEQPTAKRVNVQKKGTAFIENLRPGDERAIQSLPWIQHTGRNVLV